MSAYNGVSMVWNVVPSFLASLSAIFLPSSPTWEGTHKYLEVISVILKNIKVQSMCHTDCRAITQITAKDELPLLIISEHKYFAISKISAVCRTNIQHVTGTETGRKVADMVDSHKQCNPNPNTTVSLYNHL